MNPVLLHPVGVVRSPRTDLSDDFWGDMLSTIELDGAHFTADSLIGLTEYSHLLVVFHMHMVPEERVLRAAAHPRGNPAWPRVGVFAQRKKDRPNRIGVSVCELLRVEGLSVHVKALDAIDGTPILDIKPHVREFMPDSSRVRQPDWQTELMKNYYGSSHPAL